METNCKMIGALRQRFGPTRRRVKDQIEQANSLTSKATPRELEQLTKDAKKLLDKLEANFKTIQDLMNEITLTAADNEVETNRLESEAEDYVTLTLRSHCRLTKLLDRQ